MQIFTLLLCRSCQRAEIAGKADIKGKSEMKGKAEDLKLAGRAEDLKLAGRAEDQRWYPLSDKWVENHP